MRADSLCGTPDSSDPPTKVHISTVHFVKQTRAMETGKYFSFSRGIADLSPGYFPEGRFFWAFCLSLKIHLMEMFFILDFHSFSALKRMLGTQVAG